MLAPIQAFAHAADEDCGVGIAVARREGEDGEGRDDGVPLVVSPCAFASDGEGVDVRQVLVLVLCPNSQHPSLELDHHVSFVVCAPWLCDFGTRFSLASRTTAAMWLARICGGW